MICTVLGEMSASLAFITYLKSVVWLCLCLWSLNQHCLAICPVFWHMKLFLLLLFLADLDFMPSRSVFESFSSRFFCSTAISDTNVTKRLYLRYLFARYTSASNFFILVHVVLNGSVSVNKRNHFLEGLRLDRSPIILI